MLHFKEDENILTAYRFTTSIKGTTNVNTERRSCVGCLDEPMKVHALEFISLSRIRPEGNDVTLLTFCNKLSEL